MGNEKSCEDTEYIVHIPPREEMEQPDEIESRVVNLINDIPKLIRDHENPENDEDDHEKTKKENNGDEKDKTEKKDDVNVEDNKNTKEFCVMVVTHTLVISKILEVLYKSGNLIAKDEETTLKLKKSLKLVGLSNCSCIQFRIEMKTDVEDFETNDSSSRDLHGIISGEFISLREVQ